MDVSASTTLFGTGETITHEIRNRIYKELGITVSIGVNFNKIFAKLGSDMKKPNTVTVITKENYKQKVWTLPVSDLLYVGRATTKKMNLLSIHTIGDLANYNEKLLYNNLGKWGIVLYRFANGFDDSSVKKKGEEAYIKSVGNSITAPKDLKTFDDVKAVIYMLANSVAARLREYKLKCNGVQISVRDKHLVSCDRQEQLKIPTFISSEIAEKALDIFSKKYHFRDPLRSIGVRGIKLTNENANTQLSLFDNQLQREKQEKAEHMIDNIRKRFGFKAVTKGIILSEKELTNINPKSDHIIHPVNFFDGAIL